MRYISCLLNHVKTKRSSNLKKINKIYEIYHCHICDVVITSKHEE